MNKLKTIRGEDGVEVTLHRQQNDYFITLTGKKPEARIYRDSNGRVYGTERFKAPTTKEPIPLRANNKADAEYQADIVLHGLEQMPVANPPPLLPEPETPEWLKNWLGEWSKTAQPQGNPLLRDKSPQSSINRAIESLLDSK